MIQRPAILKESTREDLLSTANPSQVYGKRTVDEANVQAAPKIVKVDFGKYNDSSVNTIMKSVKPAYVNTDEALFREITSKFYVRGTNLRAMFNQIGRIPVAGASPKVPVAGETIVITMEQFRTQLQEWGLQFSAGQLGRFFSSFEESPGKGLTYTGFTQLVAEMNSQEVSGNRLLNLYLMERFEATDKNGPLASTCLLPTEVQAGQLARLTSQRKPIYGSQCGLDVNFDGTNNGFY